MDNAVARSCGANMSEIIECAGGTAARFANTDPDPGQQQLPEVGCSAAQRGHQAPDPERQRNNIAPGADIRPASDWHTHGHVEDGEGETAEQTQLPVHQAEILLDGLLQNHDDLTVDEIENIDAGQQTQRIVTITGAERPGGVGCSHTAPLSPQS